MLNLERIKANRLYGKMILSHQKKSNFFCSIFLSNFSILDIKFESFTKKNMIFTIFILAYLSNAEIKHEVIQIWNFKI